MAGTAIFTYDESPNGNVVKLSWVCSSDASGDVSSPTITEMGGLWHHYSPLIGVIGQVRITPGSGANQPTNAYVVRLHPSDTTIDFLGGLGASCSDTNTVIDVPATAATGAGLAMFNDIVTPYATGVGNVKQFTLSVYLWVRGK